MEGHPTKKKVSDHEVLSPDRVSQVRVWIQTQLSHLISNGDFERMRISVDFSKGGLRQFGRPNL